MNGVFPIERLPDELVKEIITHLPQRDRLNVCLVNKRISKLALNVLYRRIYLNDSNVVESDAFNLAINWTYLYIPSNEAECWSRGVANSKLDLLIRTLSSNQDLLNSVQWIRINWDLDKEKQAEVLRLLCSYSRSLVRLENVTDPDCNDIIANGIQSSRNVTSLDTAPPNSMPEREVPRSYLPSLAKYLKQRISTNLSHMTLFMDPIQLFNNVYPLEFKLQIYDLKLHWRTEYYPPDQLKTVRREPLLTKLSDIFDVRTLHVLTIISWNESLNKRELEILVEFYEFVEIRDLSLISMRQNPAVLIELFKRLKNLKRLKTDFLHDFTPHPVSTDVFLAILLNCRDLQFLDIRFENIDQQIISIEESRFKFIQNCHCDQCNHVFQDILYGKFFNSSKDMVIRDLSDLIAKDIFTMMKYLSLLPYSKAFDTYPSVRTQPMNLADFVTKINECNRHYKSMHRNTTPFEPITESDVIECCHAMVHHNKKTYTTILSNLKKLRYLTLNDIPSIILSEDGTRFPVPVFFNNGYQTNMKNC
ncbi:F-box protein YJL149W [Kluyveromyces marxianus DMKU3-1042]|uniref:F-box protein YJL149W n=1 Tax=Kluyveromyces marxianus (strain DMKU3-1042 / BCC 29191 / NBRC 104275) TaxID=1003335 RepID=W0T5A1_KLUMD|nr:uncharacterized protein KLMA_10364 [Kluyveromyces marxianus DMKU3-1042]BAO37986.1 F-box protein YJL149W [Kluyveromyces marxianus DMKU3-1042]